MAKENREREPVYLPFRIRNINDLLEYLSFVKYKDLKKQEDSFFDLLKNFMYDYGVKDVKAFFDKNKNVSSLVEYIIEHPEYYKYHEISGPINTIQDFIDYLNTLYVSDFEEIKNHPNFKSLVKNLLPKEMQKKINKIDDPYALSKQLVLYVNEKKKKVSEKKSIDNILEKLMPDKIKSYLDQYIISQEEPKTRISFAIYKYINSLIKGKTYQPNLFLIGPSGSGKSYLVRKVVDYLNDVFGEYPYLEEDISKFTASGYVGRDVDAILALFADQYEDIYESCGGIIFLDEIDKRASENTDNDVAGVKVQHELLKIIDGSDKGYVDSSKLLFILAGAFDGLFDDEKHIGFIKQDYYEKKINADDLKAYGIIPELIRRVPNIVQFKPLTKDDYYAIMKNAKDNALSKYLDVMYDSFGVQIRLGDEFLQYLANLAEKKHMGASGIDAVIDEVFAPIESYIFDKDVTYLRIDSVDDLKALYHKINKQD